MVRFKPREGLDVEQLSDVLPDGVYHYRLRQPDAQDCAGESYDYGLRYIRNSSNVYLHVSWHRRHMCLQIYCLICRDNISSS